MSLKYCKWISGADSKVAWLRLHTYVVDLYTFPANDSGRCTQSEQQASLQ